MTTIKKIAFKNNDLNVTIANQFFSRLRGLLFKPALKLDEALLISPCKSVHTLGMRYPIDIVFLSPDYQILKIVNDCMPLRLASCPQAKHTLELLSGESSRLGLKVGMPFPSII